MGAEQRTLSLRSMVALTTMRAMQQFNEAVTFALTTGSRSFRPNKMSVWLIAVTRRSVVDLEEIGTPQWQSSDRKRTVLDTLN